MFASGNRFVNTAPVPFYFSRTEKFISRTEKMATREKKLGTRVIFTRTAAGKGETDGGFLPSRLPAQRGEAVMFWALVVQPDMLASEAEGYIGIAKTGVAVG